MLKQRVITAIVLLAIILAATFLLPPAYFALFLGSVILAAAWEWSRLAGFKRQATRISYLILFAGLLLMSRQFSQSVIGIVLAVSIFWWAVASYFILYYPRYTNIWGHRLFLGLAGFLVLIPGWLSLLYLRDQQNFAVLILIFFAVVAAVDIGAYFSGRAFGRNKLAPRVSPNKTWEGFWGGVIACCLLVLLIALSQGQFRQSMAPGIWLQLVLFSLLLGAISVVGDLLESMIKRFRDVKDSGNLLPGHGGILDRIDSLSAAAPVYVLLVMSLGMELR